MLRPAPINDVAGAPPPRAARSEAEIPGALARELAAELDPERAARHVVEAARVLIGAQCAGLFCWSVGAGEAGLRVATSGAGPEIFRLAGAPKWMGASPAAIRSEHPTVVAELSPGRENGSGRRVRCFMKAAGVGRRGTVAELWLGHPDVSVFSDRARDLTSSLAAHAAVCLDNACAHAMLQRELELHRLAGWPTLGAVEGGNRLLTQLPVAVCVADIAGRIISYNRRAAEIWGREPSPGETLEHFSESLGVFSVEGGPPGRHASAMATVLREGRSDRREVVFVARDGRRLMLAVAADPLRDESGAQIGAMCVFHDISERKSEESALRASEEAHRRIVQNLPAAVYICDVEGRIQMFNEAAVELWGRSPEIGVEKWCGARRLYDENGEPVRLEDCPMAAAIRQRRPVVGREVIIEREDGTRRRVLPHPRPLLDEEGRVIGAINMLFDVTEQRRAAETRNLLAAIVDSSQDAIISKTLDGRITSWNAGARQMFGYAPGEAIGRHVTMLIPRELWDEEHGILRELRDGKRVRHFETRRLHKNGSVVHVALTISPVRDDAGRIIGASKVARDITERRRHEEEVRRLNERLREHVRELETLLDVLPIGVFIAQDPACRRITANAAGAAMLRLASPDANASRTADERDRSLLRFRVLRDGKEVPDEDLPMQRCARTGQSVRGEEYEIVFDDGSVRYLYEFATPLVMSDGRVRGCVAAFIDITDRKHHESQMRLVMAELNHRVKNTLAVVDATAQQTLRHAPDMEAFGAAFGARLRALAQAHGLLTQTDWQGAELTGLALAELRPRVADPAQVQLSGPTVVLRPNAALALHMVLHELSTNAAKYGALSADGRVQLAWSIDPAGPEGTEFELTWVESGGPRVSQPSRHGFGTKVLTRTIAHELQGTVSLDYAPEGVRCAIRFPWTGRVGFIAASR